jgi:hypothetical protein
MAREAQQDCPSPKALARSVQGLLDEQGWTGWTAEVQAPLAGPCATVTGLDGSGQRRIDGGAERRTRAGASRSSFSLIDTACQ